MKTLAKRIETLEVASSKKAHEPIEGESIEATLAWVQETLSNPARQFAKPIINPEGQTARWIQEMLDSSPAYPHEVGDIDATSDAFAANCGTQITEARNNLRSR